MAYIPSERVAEIRKEIKSKFAGWKFSITRRHYSIVDVAILQAPIDLMEGEEKASYSDGTTKNYHTVNYFWIDDHYKDQPLKKQILNDIKDIMMVGNYDNSDLQSDYHDVGFYIDLSIGQWDRDFVYAPDKGIIPELREVKKTAKIIELSDLYIGKKFFTDNATFRVKAIHA